MKENSFVGNNKVLYKGWETYIRGQDFKIYNHRRCTVSLSEFGTNTLDIDSFLQEPLGPVP